ncbi:LOW QUALITY PROTEIN: uncharacterized protein ACNLHF_012642 [Anomaloglossus baeobatrachus]
MAVGPEMLSAEGPEAGELEEAAGPDAAATGNDSPGAEEKKAPAVHLALEGEPDREGVRSDDSGPDAEPVSKSEEVEDYVSPLFARYRVKLWSFDKSCINSVFSKKRLVMLAKLVSTFEESISKSEHLETLASTRKAEEVTFHCQCCVENMKQIHTLETELRDRVECSAERGKQICMLESRISEKETYYSDMDKELLQLYMEINQFKNRVVSTDELVSTLREDLAAKTQVIADLQQVISNLSRPDMNSMSTISTKQVCVSGTTQEETAATVSTPPRDHRSGDSETRGQVERSLQFTPIPMEVRRSSRFWGEDYSWRCESRWDANPTTSNLPNCSERQEEFYPNHKSMEMINFLLRICKEIPKYDPNVDPFTSCDLFEGQHNTTQTHGKTYEAHLEHLAEVFDALSKYGMKLKTSKCHLLKPKVQYLGHVVWHQTLKRSPPSRAGDEILAYPNYGLPFVLYTDTSNVGLGAVLSQVQKGKEKVIAYASRPTFEAKIFQEFCHLYGCKKIRTTPYHAQTNGMREKMNHLVINLLNTLLLEERNLWPEKLPDIVDMYNHIPVGSTKCT